MRLKITLLAGLMITVSLAGCLGETAEVPEMTGGEGEPESYSTNQQPLIYGNFRNVPEAYHEGDWYDSLVRATDFFASDPDGNITNFGMDWDNDYEIDWSFPWDWNASHSETFAEFNYSVVTIHPPANQNDLDGYCSTDYLNLIAEDELGLKEIQPVKWIFEWDSENQVCLVGPRT